MTRSLGPPSVIEIIALPACGAIAIELVRTPKNELILLFAPFLVAIVRIFIAQFQVPPQPIDAPSDRRISDARRCVGLNQVAVFFLILFEGSVLIAGAPGTPGMLWMVSISTFAVYVAIRLLSRQYWLAAAAQLPL